MRVGFCATLWMGRISKQDAGLQAETNKKFWKDYARAMAGALIFALPLLMTMETWWLGMYLERYRIALFLVVLMPVLFGLSYFAGFRCTEDWRDDIIDALVAVTAGVAVATVVLAVFNILSAGMSLDEFAGKIAILTVPASIGAIVASKQLGGEQHNKEIEQAGYGGELFIMAAGALFFAFNVAPTEEMFLIAYKMSEWHGIVLILVSLLVMHAFVYSVGFHGQEEKPAGASSWKLARHFTVVGYAVALATSAYVLWTFGRFDGLGWEMVVSTTAVLGFPSALGAALARLLI